MNMIVWDFGLVLGNAGYQNGAIARQDGVPDEVEWLDGSPILIPNLNLDPES